MGSAAALAAVQRALAPNTVARDQNASVGGMRPVPMARAAPKAGGFFIVNGMDDPGQRDDYFAMRSNLPAIVTQQRNGLREWSS